jgi:hypothetical protein
MRNRLALVARQHNVHVIHCSYFCLVYHFRSLNMKTVNIKGKEYVEVNERIKEFRKNFKDYSLTTEIIELTPEHCVLKAIITDDKGIIRATGLAQEDRDSSYINKTSYIENCETSAWGRALGNFGIGVDKSICSAEELLVALNAQQEKKTSAKTPEQSFLTVGSSVKAAATRAGKYELSDAEIVSKAEKSTYSDEELAKKTQGAIDFFSRLDVPLLANDQNIFGAKLLIELNTLRENFVAADKLKETYNAAIERTSALNDSIPY